MVYEYARWIYSVLAFTSLFWVFLLSPFSCLPNRMFSDLDFGCWVIGKSCLSRAEARYFGVRNHVGSRCAGVVFRYSVLLTPEERLEFSF